MKAGAPSKLNCPISVPTAPLTLTPVRIAEPPYACGTHATAVADVHALLPHTSAVVSEAVTLALKRPKLSPLIVTVPPPLPTALAETVLTTGPAHAPSACKSHTGSPLRCGAAQRTVEAELPYQRAHRSTHTHRSPHRRAAVRLRNARNRCRRRPRAAAAHVRRGKRGSHACAWACAEAAEAQPADRHHSTAARHGVGRNRAHNRPCTRTIRLQEPNGSRQRCGAAHRRS